MFRNNNREPFSRDDNEPRTNSYSHAVRSSMMINRQTINRPGVIGVGGGRGLGRGGGGGGGEQPMNSEFSGLLQLIADGAMNLSDQRKRDTDNAQGFPMPRPISNDFLALNRFDAMQYSCDDGLKQLEKVASEGPPFTYKYRKEFVDRIRNSCKNSGDTLKDRKVYDELLSISGLFVEKYKPKMMVFERYADAAQQTPLIMVGNYWGMLFFKNWMKKQGFGKVDFGSVERLSLFDIKEMQSVANRSHIARPDNLKPKKPTYAEVVWGVKSNKVFEKIQMHSI